MSPTSPMSSASREIEKQKWKGKQKTRGDIRAQKPRRPKNIDRFYLLLHMPFHSNYLAL